MEEAAVFFQKMDILSLGDRLDELHQLQTNNMRKQLLVEMGPYSLNALGLNCDDPTLIAFIEFV